MIRILVSACLLGEKVRYDGGGFNPVSSCLTRWFEEGRLVSICPEVAGGLGVPRPPAEIQAGTGDAVLRGEATVLTNEGKDVTGAFLHGARHALEIALKADVKLAILKARSPSCGSRTIYDGQFTGRLIDGAGVTAALLRQHDIAVFSEETLVDAEKYLELLENRASGG